MIGINKGVARPDSGTGGGRGGRAGLGKKKFDLLSMTSSGPEMVPYCLYCESKHGQAA